MQAEGTVEACVKLHNFLIDEGEAEGNEEDYDSALSMSSDDSIYSDDSGPALEIPSPSPATSASAEGRAEAPLLDSSDDDDDDDDDEDEDEDDRLRTATALAVPRWASGGGSSHPSRAITPPAV